MLLTNFNFYVQKNRELSEETQYRYRPVNLLLEPYFLPTPVRWSCLFKAEDDVIHGLVNNGDISHQKAQAVKEQ